VNGRENFVNSRENFVNGRENFVNGREIKKTPNKGLIFPLSGINTADKAKVAGCKLHLAVRSVI
jgi:hypothetical protein